MIIPHPNHRDTLGRFTKGCRPGPGRPRKLARRSYVDPQDIHRRFLDLQDTAFAWENVVNGIGPKAARDMLADLEAENGPISFRHIALGAIIKAEQAQASKLPRTRSRKSPRHPSARHKPELKSSSKC